MDDLRRAAFAVRDASDKVKNHYIESAEKVTDWWYGKEFPYDRLPTPTSVRLIKLDRPSSERGDDKISFVMKTADLELGPRFTALSYTWNLSRSTWSRGARRILNFWMYEDFDEFVELFRPETESQAEMYMHLNAFKKVTCNGKPMKVHQNLFQGLKQLRKKRQEEWFWIDALCINQSDEDEKVAQIPLMGRIYHQAQLVVVWLGDLNKQWAKGLQLLEDVAASKRPLPPDSVLMRLPMNGGKFLPPIESPADMKEFFTMFATATHLICRPYFRRVWVVQELCLARKVVYLHGEYEVTPEALQTAWKWILFSTSDKSITPWNMKVMKAVIRPLVGAQMELLPSSAASHEGFSRDSKGTLINWLRVCMGRQATHDKDFVFAGLSLIREDLLTIDQSLQPVVTPPAPPPPESGIAGHQHNKRSMHDYDGASSITPNGLWPVLAARPAVSAPEVLVNAAACLLTHESVETLFTLASRMPEEYHLNDKVSTVPREIGKTAQTLPSWVPAPGSWKSEATSDLIPPKINNPWCAGPARHASAGDASSVSPVCSISPNGRELIVDAATVDTVSAVDFDVLDLLKLMRFMTQRPVVYNGVAEARKTARQPSLLEAIAFTMVAGHVNGKRITHAQAGKCLCESIESMVHASVLRDQHELAGQTMAREKSEAAARKAHGSGADLQTAPSAAAEQWRADRERETNTQKSLADVIAEFEKLKHLYAHMPWPGEAVRHLTSEEAILEVSSNELREKKMRRKAVLNFLMGQPSHGFGGFRVFPPEKDEDPFFDVERPVSDECRAFEEACMSMLAWRRLFVTRTGLVGLAPTWVREGHHVMLVSDSSVPFVFSRARGTKRDTWTLQGEAFVDGIMLWEARELVDMDRICVV
ncbi:heterokaryon incompatibility protein-domain-containing protein [Microdochium trichocladiopsis]|uniref:Heterokaryon incompatibility protein-domain-containing protein n=1 Tax=Microdochium trichocladiopsis TaxID=1682393 RepID=A0A9P8XWH6_9PEZI|nr:heterokaryon incompatibility protein-domain-containing protein [Microdochium trichocladiopsis]KAH7024524.1 heterokaryon incompatibility protein-domain-containing protein [Microdochium trichocladiopsis]